MIYANGLYCCSSVPNFVILLFQHTKFCYIVVPAYQILLYCCSSIPNFVISLFQDTKFCHILVPVYQVLSKSVNKSLEFIMSYRLTIVNIAVVELFTCHASNKLRQAGSYEVQHKKWNNRKRVHWPWVAHLRMTVL